jgi:Na+/proline symporter
MPKADAVSGHLLIASGYNNELQTSEMFSTAGRTVKSGLVASAVVSSWTWAATLLQSSGVAYRYGVSGPFWVGSQ